MLQDFAQQVENTARAVVNDIHTALPGKIVAFDPEKGVASVQPKGKYLTTEGASLDYPMISDVPVTFPYCQTANVGLVFPIKPDDNCMIIISEVELDEWRNGAESEAPIRYDLTSAMLIPGLCLGGVSAMKKAVENDAVVIASGPAEIVIGSGKIALTGDMTVEGNVTVTGNFEMTGNAKVNGNQEVSGNVTAHGKLAAGHGAEISGGAKIDGDTSISGSETVSGSLTAGGISMTTHTHTGYHGETGGPH